MTPDIFEVLPALNIDLVVSAGSGHAEFPFSGIHNIPIILINIFGQPNVQKNITHHVCISHEVAKKISPFVPAEKIRVMYIPSEPMPEEALRWGKELRHSFQIPDNALVLGRVGRASDDIFDPIGIRAFQSLVDRYQDVHYLIVAPPPALREIVEKERIPRVHFHPGSGLPKDMWSFYGAMDVLAHFRRDGESFGLNIAQAMLAGRPILSHRSSIWNAHAEYLKPDFSRIADVNDEKGYAKNIEWIVGQWREGALPTIGLKARQAAENLVLIDRHIDEFETYIIEALRKKF
jgi:glycosyltransferase involved in cell wall biosynthesis